MNASSSKNHPLAVFRFDASPAVGGGHALRCMTLAQGLRAAGWDCLFAVGPDTRGAIGDAAVVEARWLVLDGAADPAGEARRIAARLGASCDLLVVDHYGRDRAFEAPCRAWAPRILAIDDLADRCHDCDVLLDQTLGRDGADYAPLVPAGCRLLMGCDYALLNSRFAGLRQVALGRRRNPQGVRRILVAFGLMDHANLSASALAGIELAGIAASVDVVLGGNAPHLAAVRAAAGRLPGKVAVATDVADMAERMAAADLALGAAGTTSWERCCLGLPSLVAVVADNQRKIARELAAAGAVEMLGEDAAVTPTVIAEAIGRMHADPRRLAEMSVRAARVCDGQGVRRVMEVLAA